ncbi:MAG TPA: winged helix-turn-helix domain-containing protein [Candidatus Acidoferrum sp.]|nr:winged helix-turn-helix domain-containing protein [Candidatus Acidoferrum sp.]
MALETRSSGIVQFGTFEADLRSGELRKQGKRIKIQEQPFQVLTILLRHPGEVVTREELRNQNWPPDTFVDFDNSLNTAINKLRDALGDSADSPRFIETLPRRGYRFIGAVNGARQPQVSEAKPPRGLRSLIFPVAFGLLAVVGITAVLLGLNVHGWRDRLFVHAAKPRIQALAVLPLTNLSGNPEQEYFADGMTEALITELGKTSIPRVISRQSVMQFKASKKPLQEIARELNVDAVLEGAVELSGDRVRVSVHLDQVSPEGQLWANQYDRDIHDVLPLQDEIARTVTDEIRVKLTPEERTRLTTAHSVSPEAHDDYLRGRYILGLAMTHHTAADKRQYSDLDVLAAIAHFKHAIEKDPAWAMAYAGLADAYVLMGNPLSGHSPKENLADAKEAAIKALDLDPSLAEAHFSLAQILEYDWNWSEAEKEFKLALKLNTNYADAHLEHGRFVQALGRNDEALREMNYAMELDPFGLKTRVVVAYVTWASHQYDLALQQFKSLGDDSGLVWTYREKQMYPEALAALERWNSSHRSQRRDPYYLATAASIYGLEGRKQQAEKLIDELREVARRQYVSGFFFAEAYLGIGQKDQAVTWLERAYDEHDQWMVYIASYPGLDRLHSEPRFQALLRRMNFPQ